MKKFFKWWVLVLVLGLAGFAIFSATKGTVRCLPTVVLACGGNFLAVALYGMLFVLFMIVTLAIVWLFDLFSKSNQKTQTINVPSKSFSIYRVILVTLIIVIVAAFIYFILTLK